jgi:HNH endonuclease
LYYFIPQKGECIPFSHTVRDEALVAAARHCCVCHRYKGVKVEVHHIIPESKGGASDRDNAITLCYDCHADAGHYNLNHPRGTKFSPAELRRHRDQWHEMVISQKVQFPDTLDLLYCRFLLCKSFEAIREITLSDLSYVPVTQPLLVTNSVRSFQRKIIDAHPVSYRHDKEWGEEFPDRESYAKTHPDVPLDERSGIKGYPYFEASRTPSAEELREKLASRDGVTRLLIEAGVDPQNISHAFAYYEECGSNRFQEIYRLRPLWTLYLAATNLSQDQVILSGTVCEKYEPPGAGYREFSSSLGHDHHNSTEALPSAPLLPGATMLFPVATLLGPIENIGSESTFEERSDLPTRQVQVVSHEDLSASHASTALIGPVFWPKSIHFQVGPSKQEQQIHEFNLSHLYSIRRYWEMGSCPHLFSITNGTRPPKYLRELFARQPGKAQTERIKVSTDTDSLLIAELELEQTIIEEILVNGNPFMRNATLNKCALVWVPVQPGDGVEMTGYYVARAASPTDPWLRNSLIQEFLDQAPPAAPVSS